MLLVLLRMYTPLCLMDMVEDDTSDTWLLMTPLVRAVIGTAASVLVLLQATMQPGGVFSTAVRLTAGIHPKEG
jgi:hypothetical protein